VDRRRTILDAAAAAFHEKGFHGVGVDEIGSRAGLSGPSLYRHVSGKDEILATLLDEAMDELLAAAAPTDRDPADDLERALLHHIRFAQRRADLVTLYQREVRSLVDPWRTAFRTRRGEYAERWAALFARRFPALHATVVSELSQAALGTIFSIPTWPAAVRDGEGVAPVVLTLVLEGAAGVASAS
jgi:AcrR family transcriptional regulator